MPKSNRVADTNDSSSSSKLSMVRAKYVSNYGIYKNALEWFVKPERRTSLINRGYYIRVEAIRRLFHAFILAQEPRASYGEKLQIVNLGAGFDVLFLCSLKENSVINDLELDERFQDVDFVEVDLENVVRRKLDILHSKIRQCCNKTLAEIFPRYRLVGCDLSNAEAAECALRERCGLSPARPTLFLAECVFNYLTAKAADRLIALLSKEFHRSTFVVYEQVEPFDKFGQTMMKHFESISSPLLSIGVYPSVGGHFQRYADAGFPAVNCWTIGDLYDNLLTLEERRRVESLELFDEYEMWHAKCAHYVVTLASLDELLQKRITQQLSLASVGHLDEKYSSTASLTCVVHPLGTADGCLRRFAHKSAFFTSMTNGMRRRYLFTVGGWCIGDRNQQGRSRKPCFVDLDNFTGIDCETFSNDGDHILERCYHTLNPVLDDRTFFLFGGRRSPAEAIASPCLLRIKDDGRLGVVEITTTAEEPIGRWRHAACSIDSSDSVVICGGRTSTRADPLSDCWSLSLKGHVWRRLPDTPIGVHSHSVCYSSRYNLLIVVGGLTVDDKICDRLQFYSFEKDSWTILEAPVPFWRYGTASRILFNSFLVGVGGASPKFGELHDVPVLRFSLDEFGDPTISSSVCFELPGTLDRMLLNHDAVVDPSTQKMFVFGGGGNCFSFGTCFNESILEIPFCEDHLKYHLQ